MQFFHQTEPSQHPNMAGILPDPWLAKSSLQKAIRRGDTDIALKATSLLLERQPEGFWRRLVVIALEDVGIADLDLVREVLVVSGRKAWRADNGGDWPIASDLVSRLCLSVKCRDACDALVIADLHPAFASQRSAFLDLGNGDYCDILSDGRRPLGHRVLAAWLLAGTKRFPAALLPDRAGSFSDLLAVYQTFGVSPHVLEVARLGSTRTVEGHPLTLPLIWLLAHETDDRSVASALLAPARLIRGWPSYAYDMHTRPGRAAIGRFLSGCQPLADLAGKHVPRHAHEDFTGTLIFRLEGEIVDKRLAYPGSQALLRDAEVAHLTHQGLPNTLVSDALEVAQEHLELLHQCRIEATRR